MIEPVRERQMQRRPEQCPVCDRQLGQASVMTKGDTLSLSYEHADGSSACTRERVSSGLNFFRPSQPATI